MSEAETPPPTTHEKKKQRTAVSKEEARLVSVSKSLSRVLRHQALSLGLRMSSDGFVALADLLALKAFHGVSLQTIQEVVADNNKKRFELVLVDESRPADSECVADYKIRAVQGHSIAIVEDEGLLEEITDTSAVLARPVAVHGTYRRFLPSILREGLKRMSRNHIHLAVDMPGAEGVISGLRASAEIAVLVDVDKARAAGARFFLSKNRVVLTKGVHDNGVIPPELFKDVIALDGKPLDLEEIANQPEEQPESKGHHHKRYKERGGRGGKKHS